MYYYGTNHWVTDVIEGPDGRPWYQVEDQLGRTKTAIPYEHLRFIDDAEFDRFLAALTARTGLVVHVTDQGRTIIKNIAESTLNSAMQTPGRPAQNAANVAIRLEPPFITKLRALVHLLTDPEAKRAENFDVAEHEDDEW